MNGILEGVRVLDVGRGIAGPMTAMLLADHGADVVRVEPPGGDGLGGSPGSVVWGRGRRRVELDLATGAGRAAFLDLAARADVLVETFRPGVAEQLGLDAATVRAVNGRLVHASITGYGRDTADADRPDIEWLVTARTGLQWDQRGWYGTRMDHIMGTDLAEPGFAVPDGVEQTGCREGPIFLAVPWASIGAAFLSVTAISAGLYVADRTGTGQHVETSLAQACIMMNAMGWQRVARMHPSYRLWYFDRRAPKGIFAAGDG
ncbi:MAG: CoA transferase, partial [Ilumatobacteraceae bacterium]